MKYIIIGLGNFGTNLGLRLCDLGHEVIGIDERENVVEEYKDLLTGTVCMNSVDEAALRSQPIFEVDAIVVAIGEDWAASTQTIALLKTLGVKRIIGRSLSHLHEMVLKGLEIEEIINPENTAAQIIANSILSKKVVGTYNLTNSTSIDEIVIPQMFVGQTVDDINMEKNFELKLVAVKRLKKSTLPFSGNDLKWETHYLLNEPLTFQENDHIVVCGSKQQIQKLLRLLN